MKVFNREMPVLEFVAMLFIFIGILAIILIFSVADIGEVFEGKAEHTILEFGDFLGGFVGSIWALAGVLLFYAAINEQRKDLEDQRDMMERQINEVVQQTNEFRKQSDTLQVQKNEETFFQLLRFHNEIITSITLEIQDIDFATSETRIRQIHGRKSFVEYYDIYKRFFHVQFENLTNPTPELLDKAINASYGQFYTEYQSDLGHYFRNLYNVLRFIDSLPEDQKKFYLSLLLAQLSNYELALLFFHGLDAHNNDFKLFLEKYTILTTVPNDEIINICRKLYDPKAFHPEGLEVQVEDDMFSFGDMGGMGDDFGMMGGFGGFGANKSSELDDDIDEEGMDGDILSKIASLNKAASSNSNDLSENSILSRLSKIKNNDDNDNNLLTSRLENEEPSIGEDEIANRLSLIKKATSNKNADSFNSITGNIPQQFLDNPEDDSSIQVDLLSKLSALSAKNNDEEFAEEESINNDIFAKLNKLKAQAPSDIEDDDWNAPLLPKQDETESPDNDIFAKLNKLKAQTPSDIEDDDWNAPLLPKKEENESPDNDIFAKLNKLKAQAPSDIEDDDWNAPLLPKQEENESPDNDIFAKLNKLKAQAPSDIEDDDWNTPLLPKKEENESPDNDIFAKLNKLKVQAPNDIEEDDWNTPLLTKQEENDSPDNDIFAKLNKLKVQAPSDIEDDDWNTPLLPKQEENDSPDNDIFAKLNKLKAQAPSDIEDDDWNTPLLPKQEENESPDNDIFAKLNKLKTQAPSDIEDDDWNTPLLPKQEENDFDTDSTIVENFQLENSLSNFNLDSLKSVKNEKLTEKSISLDKKQTKASPKTTKNLSSLSKYLKK